jgi:hypothetical protein
MAVCIASSITNQTAALPVAAIASATAIVSLSYYLYRKKRTQWQQAEEEKGHEALHSIIAHFRELHLDPETTVEEANQRRTTSYYEKARAAHLNVLVSGVGSYSLLQKLRRQEMDNILRHYNEGTKSHRTVVAMCDSTTAALLKDAREKILEPLNYSTDPSTPGVWIPELNVIPEQDMHVTIAIPWWWHTIREGNDQLSRDLAARFKQTLLLKFHHAFQIELQRIVLLGGKTLVALWRCVGERVNEDGTFIYDRHGENVDPFVRLRVEIVRCFTTEAETELRGQPLTYSDSKHNLNTPSPSKDTTALPKNGIKRPVLKRQNTIEEKTPGVGQGDGFIHTTLCRLPLECLSQSDVKLDKVHRLCREATEFYSGHRMVISKFRFIETVGRGGESNPCMGPIYDETIEAPSRVKANRAGGFKEVENLHVQVVNSSSLTIGAVQNAIERPSVVGLFDNSELTIDEDDASVVTLTAPMLI